MSIGQRLKNFRIENDLSQHEIGKVLGCSASNYCRIENDQLELKTNHLIVLCNHYKVSADYFLELPIIKYIKDREEEISKVCTKYINEIKNYI